MDWFKDLLDFAFLPPDSTNIKSEPSAMDGESENDLILNPISSSDSDKHPEDVLRLLPYTVEKVVLIRLNGEPDYASFLYSVFFSCPISSCSSSINEQHDDHQSFVIKCSSL